MNISLSEILLVLVVALVVIKPEHLPGTAFKLGKWAKQIRRAMTKLRQELDGTVGQLSEELEPKRVSEKIEMKNESQTP